MAGEKTRIIYGIIAKKETTYGTYTAPSVSTDGVPVMEFPEATLSYGVSGDRGGAAGNNATLKRTPPSAPVVTCPIKMEARGAGAAYSASVYPPEHILLQASGFDATIVTTGGSESVTYAPTAGPGSFSSASVDFYTEGEKWPVNGVYCDWSFEVENGRPGIWTFDARGRLNAAASADTSTAKTIVYEAEVPPISAPLVLTFDAIATIPVEKITVKGSRELHERVKGQYGYHPGRTVPTLTFLVERPLFTTYNFFTEWSAGTANAASFAIGSTQYNRATWTFAQTQVIDVKPQGDGARAMLEVTCALHSSTQILNDWISILYN